MKIAVYAIAKNEAQFVQRFCDSAKDADVILIADTGSTDDTVEIAKQCGATVYPITIKPWRFDIARDTALALVPADIDVCISLDLDEELQPGWRDEIERLWVDGTTRMQYKFDWSNGIVFFADKIHSRNGYHWHHPCHEVVVPDGRTVEKWVKTDKLMVVHKPDDTKSRGQYLDLLELSVKEDPSCERNQFYFARELFYRGKYQWAIVELQKYLAMPQAVWENERAYAMRVLSNCYREVGGDSLKWARQACVEAPKTREVWVNLASHAYEQGLWHECFYAATNAVNITQKELVYTTDPLAWGSRPHDLLAIAAYHLGLQDIAMIQGQLAVDHEPNNQRLITNLELYRGMNDERARSSLMQN